MKLTTTLKPNRKQAFQLILEARRNNETLTTDQMDQLINYFSPAVPKKPKTLEQWVARVAADNQKDVRPYLHYCYVKDGELVATNGHRIHVVENRILPNGFYHPETMLLMDNQEECGKFPDYERVIPKFNHSCLAPFDSTRWETANFRDIFCYVINGKHFDKGYVDAAISVPENQEYCVVGDQLVFISENTTSVIMPIRNK